MHGKDIYKKGYVMHLTIIITVIVMTLIVLLWDINAGYSKKAIDNSNYIKEKIFRSEEMYRYYYNEPVSCDICVYKGHYKLMYKNKAYYYDFVRDIGLIKVVEYHGEI